MAQLAEVPEPTDEPAENTSNRLVLSTAMILPPALLAIFLQTENKEDAGSMCILMYQAVQDLTTAIGENLD